MQEYAYIHDEDHIQENLMKVPFLESFSKEHLDQVLHASALIKGEDGDILIRDGEDASRIFILLVGKIAVEKDGDRIVEMDTVGDLFGELAALKGEQRSATVVSVGKTLCLAVDQRFLEEVLPRKENEPFYAALFEFIAKLTTKRLKATSAYLAKVDQELRALKKKSAGATEAVGATKS